MGQVGRRYHDIMPAGSDRFRGRRQDDVGIERMRVGQGPAAVPCFGPEPARGALSLPYLLVVTPKLRLDNSTLRVLLKPEQFAPHSILRSQARGSALLRRVVASICELLFVALVAPVRAVRSKQTILTISPRPNIGRLEDWHHFVVARHLHP